MKRVSKQTFTLHEKFYFEILHSIIFNQTVDGGNNFLHYLITALRTENYSDVSEMIKILVLNGCDPYRANDQLETPCSLMYKKLQKVKDKNDLRSFFNKIQAFKDDKNKKANVMKSTKIEENVKKYLIQLLENSNETEFIKAFKSSDMQKNEIFKVELLEVAITRNLAKAVNLLIENYVILNNFPANSKFRMEPVFLAAFFGHHEVLKLLLNDSSSSFFSHRMNSTVLHQALSNKSLNAIDRQKCFELIVSDHRCTSEVINRIDSKGFTPLYFSCLYGYEEISKDMLSRGAYVGHESTVQQMRSEFLSETLDESIKCSSDIKDKNCQIKCFFDFLLSSDDSQSEMRSIYLLAGDPKLNSLIIHPVIALFLSMKWNKISFLVHFNLAAYLLFLFIFGGFVMIEYWLSQELMFYSVWDESFYDPCKYFCRTGFTFITFNELSKCRLFFKTYFLKLSNWLKIVFIIFSFVLLSDEAYFEYEDNIKICSATILFIAFESIQVITRISCFRLSLYINIFKKVCTTFLKIFAAYFILILAFSMSFFALKNENIGKKIDSFAFSNILSAIVLTVQMMLGDFEHLKLKQNDTFHAIVNLLFELLIAIVLYNLMNALAIRDTNKILEEVKLIDTRQRIYILYTYEKLFSYFGSTFGNVFHKNPFVSINLRGDLSFDRKNLLFKIPDEIIKNIFNHFKSKQKLIIGEMEERENQNKIDEIHKYFHCLSAKSKLKLLSHQKNKNTQTESSCSL